MASKNKTVMADYMRKILREACPSFYADHEKLATNLMKKEDVRFKKEKGSRMVIFNTFCIILIVSGSGFVVNFMTSNIGVAIALSMILQYGGVGLGVYYFYRSYVKKFRTLAREYFTEAEEMYVNSGRLRECFGCEYNLKMLESEICPECGASVYVNDVVV